jgi:sulfatase modifying factor 1
MPLHKLCLLLLMALSLSAFAGRASGESESDYVTERFRKNVVQLTVTFTDQTIGYGFGFVIGERDNVLYVLTANHVVRKANDAPGVTVTAQQVDAVFCDSPEDAYPATVLKWSAPDLDAALVKVAKPYPSYQWELIEPDPNPERGKEVWFIGRSEKCEVPLRAGLIEGMLTESTFAVDDDKVLPGTSGAPLISHEGIVGMIIKDSVEQVTAIKLETIRQIAATDRIPWGFRASAATPTVPPPLKPTATPTAKPTAKLMATPTIVPSKKGPEAGETWTDPITGMEFVWIKGGEFLMGCGVSDTECQDNEKPAHTVRVDGFWMGKYEVTQAQWQKIMGENPSNFKGDTRPVEQVSWNDAQEFIEQLNSRSGMTFRLPTEAEWEYAARAGTQTVYSFGDDANKLGEYAWYCENSGNQTHSVGQRKPSAWGLYDMHGNVWELCQDWYGPYARTPATDPRGPDSGSVRVVRGGSWIGSAVSCRSASRGRVAPDDRIGRVGFRLLRTPG